MDKKEKLFFVKKLNLNPFPEKIPPLVKLDKFSTKFQSFIKNKKEVWLGGRIMAVREHGKISFIKIQSFDSSVQIILKENLTKDYKLALKLIDIGDFFAFRGQAFLPQTKEKSLLADNWFLLSKSIKNFPKEYYKVKDEELLVRSPYLRTIFYQNDRKIFYLRFWLIQKLREILWKEGFLEVETPILQSHYGGALAKPFITYLEALKEKLYLRIAPEIYLKKMIVGGFEKIFEIGKNFRNEGVDREHNPEFTMMELYWAYQDREGLMKFTQKIIQKLIQFYNQFQNGSNSLKIKFKDQIIDFSGEWRVFQYIDLIKEKTGLDYFSNDLKDFLNFAGKEKIQFNPKIITKGKIVDEIFKKIIRPQLIQPTFLIDHPKDISPLAKTNDQDSRLTSRFQIYIGGFEVANAFAELNDPIDQKERFEENFKLLKKGEVEAHPYDETFIEALEYGMPPTAGLGIGLDRLLTIILNQKSVQDIIYFPLIKRK